MIYGVQGWHGPSGIGARAGSYGRPGYGFALTAGLVAAAIGGISAIAGGALNLANTRASGKSETTGTAAQLYQDYADALAKCQRHTGAGHKNRAEKWCARAQELQVAASAQATNEGLVAQTGLMQAQAEMAAAQAAQSQSSALARVALITGGTLLGLAVVWAIAKRGS